VIEVPDVGTGWVMSKSAVNTAVVDPICTETADRAEDDVAGGVRPNASNARSTVPSRLAVSGWNAPAIGMRGDSEPRIKATMFPRVESKMLNHATQATHASTSSNARSEIPNVVLDVRSPARGGTWWGSGQPMVKARTKGTATISAVRTTNAAAPFAR
jgi:hypothetical protein